MVSLDARFVLDCVSGCRPAIDRFRRLRAELEPMYLSSAARAAVIADAASRDEKFRRRAEEILRSTADLAIDVESVRCAAEIAEELAREGRQLGGVDLFVAAGARHHGHVLLTRNPDFAGVPGLVREPY